MPTVPARDIPRVKEVLPEMTRRGSQPPPSASRGCPLRAAPSMEASRESSWRQEPSALPCRLRDELGERGKPKKLEALGSPSPPPAQPGHRRPAPSPGGWERLWAASPELAEGADGCLLGFFNLFFFFSLLFSGGARPLQAARVRAPEPSFQGSCLRRGSARDAGSAMFSLRVWAISQGPAPSFP